MIAALNDPALVHHADQIGIHDRAQSMSDHKHGVLTFELLNGLLHQPFALTIKSTGDLIKNQQFRISQNGPRQGDALPLATTKAVTAFANECIQSIRQTANEASGLGFGGSSFNLNGCGTGCTKTDIESNAGIEQEGVLTDDSQSLLPTLEIKRTQIDAVDERILP
jgi:hypothetical protein